MVIKGVKREDVGRERESRREQQIKAEGTSCLWRQLVPCKGK